MNRREAMTVLAGASAASLLLWPQATRAQRMPVIGFLDSRSPEEAESVVVGFRKGLGELGYVEGKNVTIDFRWAGGQYDRLVPLAAELVNRRVAVICAGGPAAAPAAKAASAAIPIVFVNGLDPVKLGLVASLNRPGGNATGVYLFTSTLEQKRVELLHELAPNVVMIGALVNPTNPNAEMVSNDLRSAARALGLELHIVHASTKLDLDAAFAAMVKQGAGALVVGNDPFFTGRREQITALAARYRLPALYSLRESVAAGGLASYRSSISDAYRQAGVYAGRILKGEKAADLPVQQPTKLELVINLKTAKALGLTVPDKLMVAADEVIE